jgi:hypothetical protein
MTAGIQHHRANHDAMAAPGLEPGFAWSPYLATDWTRMLKAKSTAMAQKIQPIGLRGRREARMAPRSANGSTPTTAKGPLNETNDTWLSRPNTRPPPARETDTSASDQARRPAVRFLTPPSFRAPIVPPGGLAQKGVGRPPSSKGWEPHLHSL